MKSIVSGVGKEEEGDWCLSVWIWVGDIVVVGGFSEVFRVSLVGLLSISGLMTMANVVKEERKDEKMKSRSIFSFWLKAA